MDSGIYQISFCNGCYYIGKSENITKRWQTHSKNFQQGTHTKKMQEAYNSCGPPDYSVMLLVHPDHIDIYESILIDKHWGPQLLNTAKPKPLSPELQDVYLELYDQVNLGEHSCMLHSTAQHMQLLREHHYKLHDAQQALARLQDSGIVLPEDVEAELTGLEEQNALYYSELQRLKNLSWWSRVFHYKVYV